MAIREGCWDCVACGNKRVAGRFLACASCGRPRAKEVKFYLPPEAEVVADEARLAEARAGADWLCLFCGSGNRNGAASCERCGAGRDKAPSLETRDLPLAGESPPSGAPKKGKLGCLGWGLIAGGGGAALLIIIIVIITALANMSSERKGVVKALEWERVVQVERRETDREEGWELPSGARLINKRRALHHTDQVVVGHEQRTRTVTEKVKVGSKTVVTGHRDMGNGYFEDITKEVPVYKNKQRQETYDQPIYNAVPVFKTKYTYDIDRWKKADPLTLKGEGTDAQWPELEDSKDVREAGRQETYTARFTGPKGETLEVKLPEEKWRRLHPGDTRPLKVGLGDSWAEIKE